MHCQPTVTASSSPNHVSFRGFSFCIVFYRIYRFTQAKLRVASLRKRNTCGPRYDYWTAGSQYHLWQFLYQLWLRPPDSQRKRCEVCPSRTEGHTYCASTARNISAKNTLKVSLFATHASKHTHTHASSCTQRLLLWFRFLLVLKLVIDFYWFDLLDWLFVWPGKSIFCVMTSSAFYFVFVFKFYCWKKYFLAFFLK